MNIEITKDFQWLLGTWQNGSLHEEWTREDEISLAGVRYSLKHGTRQTQATIHLAQRRDAILYALFDPIHKTSVDLQLSFCNPGIAVFQNPGDTFPRYIRYKITPRNLLEVVIQGIRQDRKEYEGRYAFTKVS